MERDSELNICRSKQIQGALVYLNPNSNAHYTDMFDVHVDVCGFCDYLSSRSLVFLLSVSQSIITVVIDSATENNRLCHQQT